MKTIRKSMYSICIFDIREYISVVGWVLVEAAMENFKETSQSFCESLLITITLIKTAPRTLALIIIYVWSIKDVPCPNLLKMLLLSNGFPNNCLFVWRETP